ncbi:hypothetical protein WA556_000313, partial [Blastocystis sp. ATCC 50177/Nand II]
MSEKRSSYKSVSYGRKKNEKQNYKGKNNSNWRQRDYKAPSSSPFVAEKVVERPAIRYTFEELLECYQPTEIDERLQGFDHINEAPIRPWCLQPLPEEEINKAWSRCIQTHPRREHPRFEKKKMETLEEVKEEDELSEEIRKDKTPEELEKEEEEILLRENAREEKRKLKEAKMEVIPEEVIPKEEDVKEEDVKEEDVKEEDVKEEEEKKEDEVKEEEKKPMTREEQKEWIEAQMLAFINSDSGKALFQSLGDEKK